MFTIINRKQFYHWLKPHLFGADQQQAFLEDLLLLLDEGVSATTACELMSRHAKGIQADMLASVLLAIAHGQTLADGLGDFYPPHIVEAIRAGETGGTLSRAIRTAIDALQSRSSIRYTLLESLSYPLVVFVLALLVTIFVNHSILADFKSIIPLERWPQHARWLVDLADWLQHWWWGVLLTILMSMMAILFMLRYYVGRLRYGIDQIPGIGLYREFTAAHFMQTLGMLIANGMMLKTALHSLKQFSTPYLHAHLLAMEYRLGMGSDNIGDVLNTGLINTDDVRRLQLILESRSLEKALTTLGANALTQGQRRMKRVGKIGGYCLLMLSGGLACLLIFSIYDVGMSIGTSIY